LEVPLVKKYQNLTFKVKSIFETGPFLTNYPPIVFSKHNDFTLKYGFHKKPFILNATSSLLGGFAVALLVGATANPPKSEDRNGQLTRVAC
jgi:hypothetical protein